MVDEKQLASILEELKTKGIGSALIREDGILVYSTFALSDVGANAISSVRNILHALTNMLEDEQKEIEISMDKLYLVVIPVSVYLLCGVVNDREQKKYIRDAADQLKPLLQ